VSAVENGSDDAAIVESIVRLSARIGLDVVAEGVETQGQAQFLQSIGCPAAQGFFFARPQPAEVVTDDIALPTWTALPAKPPPTSTGLVEAGHLEEVRDMLGAGASLHTIAAALNRSGIFTGSGARWTAGSVARLVANLTETVER